MNYRTITHAEALHRSDATTLSTQSIALDLRGMAELETFGVDTLLHLVTSDPALYIDFLGAGVQRVEVNGEPHPFDFDGAVIRLAGLPTGEDVALRIVGAATFSRTGQGLHRFRDPSDGATYLYSHLEPSDARRIFPCIDQPDVKSRFNIEMIVPASMVALSNQPEVTRLPEGDATIFERVVFAETPPLSTYLTCFAVGNFVGKRKTWSNGKRTIETAVWARASMAKYLDDEFLDVTARGLSFFDEHFGFPYPWGKYDSILVPEYNIGAMENPGLVTFNERYVFRSRPTRAQHATRANTILHEMSHMWFGDLVTPRWWDDLWLKESFAEFMGADASAHATTFTEAWTNFAGNRKNWAYAQDQLPTTHPIKAEIPDVDAARQNFDGITYAKGAAVLKQLVHYVGRDNFYAASRDYFRAHAFDAATFDDLLSALKKHTALDLDAWANRWLKTTGPDVLTPEVVAKGGRIASLGVRVDSALPSQPTRPHRVVVGLYRDSGEKLSRYAALDLLIDAKAGGLVDVPEAQGLEAPRLVVVNDEDHTYAKVGFDATSIATICKDLHRVDDELTRAVIWTALWNLTRDAQLSAATYVDLALTHGARETNTTLSTQVFGNALHAAHAYAPPARRDDILARYASSLWRLLGDAEPGSDAQLVLARAAVAALAWSPEVDATTSLAGLLAGQVEGLALTPDLRWSVLQGLAARGGVDATTLDAELARDDTLTGRVAHLGATHAFPTQETKEAAYELVTTPGRCTNAEVDALLAAFASPHSQPLREGFVRRYFDELESLWEAHPMEIANRLARGLYPYVPEAMQLTDQALSRALPNALRRVLLECRDGLRRRLACQEVDV